MSLSRAEEKKKIKYTEQNGFKERTIYRQESVQLNKETHEILNLVRQIFSFVHGQMGNARVSEDRPALALASNKTNEFVLISLAAFCWEQM